jgi:hypothetical protein
MQVGERLMLEERLQKLAEQLGDTVKETFTVKCMIHGEVNDTFENFIEKGYVCEKCQEVGALNIDKDFNQWIVYQGMKTLVQNKVAEKINGVS